MEMEKLNDEWHVIRVCLKWKWPDLSVDDLHGNERSEEELIDLLENRTGETRECLQTTISSYRTALDLPRFAGVE